MDWSWVVVLYALCVAQGIVPTAPHPLLVRRVGFGGWRIVDATRLVPTMQLLSIALALGEVVPLAIGDDARGAARHKLGRPSRPRLTAAVLIAIRLLGILHGAALIIGAPLAAARFGIVGLILALAVIANLTVIASVLSWRAARFVRRQYALPERTTRIRLLSPFAVPLEAALLRAHALDDAEPGQVARTLLGEAAWQRWARPHLYDIVHAADAVSAPVNALLTGVAGAELTVAESRAPVEIAQGESYCPRCGHVFRRAGECSDCGVGLVAA